MLRKSMFDQVVLLVAQEPRLRRMLRASLRLQGAKLVECRRAQDALDHLEARHPDVVLLDARLPDGGAIAATRLLRRRTEAHIIAFSDTNEERLQIAVLDAGADDHLTIPFSGPELLARVRAALRRAVRFRAQKSPDSFRVGALEVDFGAREVRLRGKLIHLTPTEYKLLGVLIESAGKVVTHERLLEEVWGPESIERVQYLRVYMGQLRRKLEPASVARYLVSEPTLGYKFRLPA
jgi:two-component system KDP operon response regulator KdpE